MGGILSTNNSLKFGGATGTNVNQCQNNHGNNQCTQTNHGNVYNADRVVTHGDKSESSTHSRSGDYTKPGLPVRGYPKSLLDNQNGCWTQNGNVNFDQSTAPVYRGGDGGCSIGGGCGGPGGPAKGNVTINHK